MSVKHLSIGSQEPPTDESLLRVYSTKICPFAQRVLLPEWYIGIHPEGKVPAIVDGSIVIVESLDICEYLEENYPENSLYSVESEKKMKEKELIQKTGLATSIYMKCLFMNDTKTTPEEWTKQIVNANQEFENELAKNGNKFFGGDKPGMLDFILLPWTEVSECISFKFNKKIPLGEQLPNIWKWKEEMKKLPICKEIIVTPERFWKVVECKLNGIEPPFDTA
ncbi:hypothetical protein JTB14_033508 [Gonioctena quinquepunctata]|nr:hypothetical protein JTB14_033508 [Gonioctena quinquepunctata]